MRNWSVNEKKLKKYPLEYQRWWHEQALNFGLKKGEKLDVNFLRENIENLNVEESSREYVKFLLTDEDK